MPHVSLRRSHRTISGLALCAALLLCGPVLAKKGGNGGGTKGGGGNGGGGGGGSTTPIQITFADEQGALGFRLSGDGLGAYVDDPDGSGVEAYLGGSGGGDIFLRLANATSRGLWLDFEDCYPDGTSCTPPYAFGIDFVSSIAVAPSVAVAGGLFGMTPGQTVEVPMDLYYDFDNPAGPGQIYFDSQLKGRNPCKNKSLYVTVTRPGTAELWTVSADTSVLACVTLPGGALSGQYAMPFQFTVETLP